MHVCGTCKQRYRRGHVCDAPKKVAPKSLKPTYVRGAGRPKSIKRKQRGEK